MASRFWNQIEIQIEIRPKFNQIWLLCITLFVVYIILNLFDLIIIIHHFVHFVC